MDHNQFEMLASQLEGRIKQKYFLVSKHAAVWISGVVFASVSVLGISGFVAARSAMDALAKDKAGQTYLARIKLNSEQLDAYLTGSGAVPIKRAIEEEREALLLLIESSEQQQGFIRNVLEKGQPKPGEEFNHSVLGEIDATARALMEHKVRLSKAMAGLVPFE